MSNKWLYTLGVRSNPEESGNSPYSFTIILEGYFAVDPDFSNEEGREKLLNANAPAMLYTIARQILSFTSARARRGRINLPTVYFPAATTSELKKAKNVSQKGKNREKETRAAKQSSR